MYSKSQFVSYLEKKSSFRYQLEVLTPESIFLFSIFSSLKSELICLHFSSLLHLTPGSRDLSQAEKKNTVVTS